jgi:hypothetical protein
VIDIVPTIYEAAKITPPDVLYGVKQKPIDGMSLVYTFDNATAPTQHGTQYFEMMGNRAIYKDGWIASTTPLRLPWINVGFEPNPDASASNASCSSLSLSGFFSARLLAWLKSSLMLYSSHLKSLDSSMDEPGAAE